MGQELWRGTRARQSSAGESAPAALAGVVRRNRRRYGGYVVHAGFAVLLLRVAISSSFEHAKDVTLRPGQSALDRRIRRALRARDVETGVGEDLARGGAGGDEGRAARWRRCARRAASTRRRTSRWAYSVGRFFGGEAESEVGLRAGFGRDIWVVIAPDLRPLAPIIDRGQQRPSAAR